MNLKALREGRGMTTVALAEAAGINQSYVSQLETGLKKNPTLDVLQSLAKALGCTVNDLLIEEASA